MKFGQTFFWVIYTFNRGILGEHDAVYLVNMMRYTWWTLCGILGEHDAVYLVNMMRYTWWTWCGILGEHDAVYLVNMMRYTWWTWCGILGEHDAVYLVNMMRYTWWTLCGILGEHDAVYLVNMMRYTWHPPCTWNWNWWSPLLPFQKRCYVITLFDRLDDRIMWDTLVKLVWKSKVGRFVIFNWHFIHSKCYTIYTRYCLTKQCTL